MNRCAGINLTVWGGEWCRFRPSRAGMFYGLHTRASSPGFNILPLQGSWMLLGHPAIITRSSPGGLQARHVVAWAGGPGGPRLNTHYNSMYWRNHWSMHGPIQNAWELPGRLPFL